MKPTLTFLRKFLLGAPRNPFSPDTQRHIAMIAFLAWIGLGADGLSSSCYGPEEAFLALGTHTHLALYIAIATAITVFIIALAYNQVIELFPSGGGGYKVATQLLGPYAGLVSGAALIVDYVLTIALSAASGMDALFSLLPSSALHFKLLAEMGMLVLLLGLNLRGMKESIKLLMPIFIGFIVIHVILILWGVIAHSKGLPTVVVDTVHETKGLAQQMGWVFVAALLLRSYSLGSGTYTGIEAVSNNVNRLAEPRVETGKWTMFYMTVSLGFTAAGIILLYLLWNVHPVSGQTLNAVVFRSILGDSPWGHFALIVTLALEAGLLLVAANTGFLAGPTVLANMAIDGWMPNRFRHLSSRLVTQNGILLFGLAALIILLWSKGSVAWLVVLYSINVFLTFSLSILGLCVYWWRQRRTKIASPNWRLRLIFSLFAFCVTAGILIVTLFSKFTSGGWVTVIVTGAVVSICLLVKRHYANVAAKLSNIDVLLRTPVTVKPAIPPPLEPEKPTAIFLVNKRFGIGMHSLLWVIRMFPGHFKNFIFLSAGVVDVENFMGQAALGSMQTEVGENLQQFVAYCHSHGFAAEAYSAYGIDPTVQLTELSEQVAQKFSNCIFFATKLIFERENWLTRLLHNETSVTLQRRLHARNLQLVLLPMRIG
jgi:amino acid transporter